MLSFLRHNQVTISTVIAISGVWLGVATGTVSVGDAITATITAITGKVVANHVTNTKGGTGA